VARGGRIVFDRCSHRVASLHPGEEGEAGSKRSRDFLEGRRYVGGGRSEMVAAIWDDLKHTVDVGLKQGDEQATAPAKKPCWDFGGLHTKLSGGQQARRPPAWCLPGGSARGISTNGIGGNGAGGLGDSVAKMDVNKQSLGALSALWVHVANKKRGLAEVGGLNFCNGARLPIKKGKMLDEHDAAASTASTTTGTD
jgi:hypothetical protein